MSRVLYWIFMLLHVTRALAETSAIIVFGDSTVDTGTNFYMPQVPYNFQADRYPYGYKAFSGKPTGRFSDGKVIVDFIAEYAKLPLIPSYLTPNTDFSKGVNFGSGGAGALSSTNAGSVVDLNKQLENFAEFCGNLSKESNVAEFEEFLANAVYLLSIGSNDYLSGYFSHPELQQAYAPQQFVTMVVSNISMAIEVLHSKGARKFVIFGVGPLGCLPPLRIVNSTGGCLDTADFLAKAHNYALNLTIQRRRQMHPDSIILAAHFYDFFLKRQNSPASYGFKEAFEACCGAGPYRGLGHCGVESEGYKICNDPRLHIWWDPYHPSEHIHEQFARALWTGDETSIDPIKLGQLF